MHIEMSEVDLAALIIAFVDLICVIEKGDTENIEAAMKGARAAMSIVGQERYNIAHTIAMAWVSEHKAEKN